MSTKTFWQTMRYKPSTRKSLLRHRASLERTLADCRSGANFEHLSGRELDQTIAALELRLAVIHAAIKDQELSA